MDGLFCCGGNRVDEGNLESDGTDMVNEFGAACDRHIVLVEEVYYQYNEVLLSKIY